MELFNYEAHQKLWMLLAENIHAAARENYAGNGYYNAYGALERLKKTLLLKHFPADEQNPENYCYACQAAKLYQEMNWVNDEEVHCEYCPLKWIICDSSGSLYRKLIDCLEINDITNAAATCIEIANVPHYNTEEEIWKRVSEKGDYYEF